VAVIRFNRGRLVLIDDSMIRTRYNPILKVELQATEAAVDWRNGFMIESEAQLTLDHYNIAVESWEPIIEPLRATLAFEQSEQMTHVEFRADSVELNVTSACILSLDRMMRCARENPLQDSTGEREAHPYEIRNLSGRIVRYSVTPGTSMVKLPSNTSRPLDLQSSSNEDWKNDMWETRQQESNQQLDLQVATGTGDDATFSSTVTVSFRRAGTFPLSSVSDESLNGFCVEVSFQTGCKLLTIRSAVQIQNECSLPFELMVGAPPTYAPQLHTIQPKDTFFVPIHLVEDGEFSLSPSGSYAFSAPVPFASSSLPCAVECIANEKEEASCFVWIAEKHSPSSIDKQFVLLPALQVTNRLPFAVNFIVSSNESEAHTSSTVNAEETIAFYGCDPSKSLFGCLRSNDYGDSKPVALTGDNYPELPLFTFENFHHTRVRMENNLDRLLHSRHLTIFSEFRLINKLNMPLLFRRVASKELLTHLPLTPYCKECVLFSAESKKESLLSIQVGSSDWSDSVNLAAEGMIQHLSVDCQEGSATRYELSVAIKENPATFWRSRDVIFSPRFHIVNHTQRKIYFKQENAPRCADLEPLQQVPFHWYDKDLPFFLTISPAGKGQSYQWSPPLEIQELGDKYIKLRAEDMDLPLMREVQHHFVIVSVHIQHDKRKNANLIVIRENLEFPALLIKNQLAFPIRIQQKKCDVVDTVNAGAELPYAWDLPEEKKKKVVIHLMNTTTELSFDKFITTEVKITLPSGHQEIVCIIIEANGPTKVMRFYSSSSWMQDSSEMALSSSVMVEGEEFVPLGEEQEPVHTSFLLSIKQAGISLIDSHPQELLYGAVMNTECEVTLSNSHSTLQVTVGRIQLNNQLISAFHPILLYCVLPENATNHYSFHLLAIKNKKMKSIHYYDFFSVFFGEMDIRADATIIDHLLQFQSQIEYVCHGHRDSK